MISWMPNGIRSSEYHVCVVTKLATRSINHFFRRKKAENCCVLPARPTWWPIVKVYNVLIMWMSKHPLVISMIAITFFWLKKLMMAVRVLPLVQWPNHNPPRAVVRWPIRSTVCPVSTRAKIYWHQWAIRSQRLTFGSVFAIFDFNQVNLSYIVEVCLKYGWSESSNRPANQQKKTKYKAYKLRSQQSNQPTNQQTTISHLNSYLHFFCLFVLEIIYFIKPIHTQNTIFFVKVYETQYKIKKEINRKKEMINHTLSLVPGANYVKVGAYNP